MKHGRLGKTFGTFGLAKVRSDSETLKERFLATLEMTS